MKIVDLPALSDVWAPGLLADSGQFEPSEVFLELGEVLAHRDRGFQPGREPEALTPSLWPLVQFELALVAFPAGVPGHHPRDEVGQVGPVLETFLRCRFTNYAFSTLVIHYHLYLMALRKHRYFCLKSSGFLPFNTLEYLSSF